MTQRNNRWSKEDYGMEDEYEDDDEYNVIQRNRESIGKGMYISEDRMSDDDDDNEDDKDSREESESLNFENKKYSFKKPCPRCRKIMKKRYTNNFVNANCNISNNNNVENDVSDKDIDSIENSPPSLKYSNTKEDEDEENEDYADNDEGLMFFKNFKHDRVYNKIDYNINLNNDNCSQNNNGKSVVLPGKFVKSKENLLTDGKISINYDKRPSTRGKLDKIERELDKMGEIQKNEITRKETLVKLRIQQQMKQQQLQQQKESQEKQSVKMSHLKRLSKILADGNDKNIELKHESGYSKKEAILEVVEENEKTKGGSGQFLQNKRPTSLPQSASQSKENSFETENVDIKEDLKSNDKIKISKLLEDQVYKELKFKISGQGQSKHPSQGDASQKTPCNLVSTPTPNISPEPSEMQSCYFDQMDESEENVEEFTEKYQPSFNLKKKSDSTYSMYDMSSSASVFVAAFFVMLVIMWMVDLCPEPVSR